ncbi:MAG: hypothetical protein AB1704_20660 [Pseudomonadota bacterium]
MKFNQFARLVLSSIVLAATLSLTACGGGGGGNSPSPTGSNSGSTATQPVNNNPIDPYTNAPATGSLTAQISGEVVSGPTTGATVTAYALNSDGSNGNAIGSVVTDANGDYTMTLTQQPTGMIRLVATGGTFTSEADNSTQKNESMELVAPYVTTTLDTFVITPLTHYASQRIPYLITQGKTLAEAYTTASSGALSILTQADAIDGGTSHAGVDYLSIVPGSSQDTLNAYSDALKALEYLDVEFDLPSHTGLRILVATTLAGKDGVVDQNGNPVDVGAWSSGVWADDITPTVATMTGGTSVQDDVYNIVVWMNEVQACTSNSTTALYARFPGLTTIFPTLSCATIESDMNAITNRIASNSRTTIQG